MGVSSAAWAFEVGDFQRVASSNTDCDEIVLVKLIFVPLSVLRHKCDMDMGLANS